MNLPKKLNTWTKTKKIGEDYLVLWESVVEIKQKQDEIIDYLSDKEEGKVKTGIPMGKHPIATKYCEVCKAEKGNIHLYEECTEEASKGDTMIKKIKNSGSGTSEKFINLIIEKTNELVEEVNHISKRGEMINPDKDEDSKGEGKHTVMCNECMPPKPMNDHKYLSGVVIHERTDCPPDTLYMVNENLFDKSKPQLKEELRDGGTCLSCGETMWVPKNQMAGAVHDKCKLKEESPKENEYAAIEDAMVDYAGDDLSYPEAMKIIKAHLNKFYVSKEKIMICLAKNTHMIKNNLVFKYAFIEDLGLEEL